MLRVVLCGWPSELWMCLCRAEDFWEGYKLFCYAYYSHSAPHEIQFRHTKLGGCLSAPPPYVLFDFVFAVAACLLQRRIFVRFTTPAAPGAAGQLVWRRHVGRCPSPNALRATCMELLPLVEMFLKWELQEDCSNLGDLMQRFDSESQLETHVLGRALLLMLRDDDGGMEMSSRRMQFEAPLDPFAAIRIRIAAVDTAFQALQPQVLLGVVCPGSCTVAEMPMAVIAMDSYMLLALCSSNTVKCKKEFQMKFCRLLVGAVCFASSFFLFGSYLRLWTGL